MVNVLHPFDLYDLFVNEIFGSMWLFIIFGLFLVIWLSIKNGWSLHTCIILCLLWILVIIGVTNMQLLLALTIIVVTVFFGWVLANKLR